MITYRGGDVFQKELLKSARYVVDVRTKDEQDEAKVFDLAMRQGALAHLQYEIFPHQVPRDLGLADYFLFSNLRKAAVFSHKAMSDRFVALMKIQVEDSGLLNIISFGDIERKLLNRVFSDLPPIIEQ